MCPSSPSWSRATPNIELRVFLRDKNADLMDQYLNQGMFRSIPVFAFFDENMNEVARLLERPPKITEELEKKMLEVRRSHARGEPGAVAPGRGRSKCAAC